MLKEITVEEKSFADYLPVIGQELFSEITELAGRLKGKRVLHINATSDGGGVAELLRGEVPLMQALGIDAHWQVMQPKPGFFEITKHIHNALQGESTGLNADAWELYNEVSAELAKHIKPKDWDIILIHDPQPAGALGQTGKSDDTTWLWRCHIDSSTPDEAVAEHFVTYLQPFDGAIYTMPQFALPFFQPPHLAFTAVTIDPLSEKNLPMEKEEAQKLVSKFGVKPARPLITQVSRFDRWKDPLGVIDAWRIAKRDIKDLQLALVGNTPNDDPQSATILEQVRHEVGNSKDVHLVVGAATDREVKAFQTASDVVIQKSIREGFGLTVTEALWAGTPVIGTRVGGIVLQIQPGKNGYLVATVQEAADAIKHIVTEPALAKRMGQHGHNHVSRHFLLPHMLRDDLKFFLEVSD